MSTQRGKDKQNERSELKKERANEKIGEDAFGEATMIKSGIENSFGIAFHGRVKYEYMRWMCIGRPGIVVVYVMKTTIPMTTQRLIQLIYLRSNENINKLPAMCAHRPFSPYLYTKPFSLWTRSLSAANGIFPPSSTSAEAKDNEAEKTAAAALINNHIWRHIRFAMYLCRYAHRIDALLKQTTEKKAARKTGQQRSVGGEI